MIKTQIHSRRRKPTKSTLSTSPGQSQGQIQGQVIAHDNNSNQSDPGHFTLEGISAGTGSKHNTEGVLDMSTAEVKDEGHQGQGHDLAAAEDQSFNANEVKQNWCINWLLLLWTWNWLKRTPSL